MKSLVMLVLLVMCQTAHAQRTATRGTVAQSFEAAEAKARWNGAKKISATPIVSLHEWPNDSVDLNGIPSEGGQYFLEYWHFKVLSIVDEKNMLLQCGSKRTLWLEDFPTDDFADNDEVRVVGLVTSVGMKEYEAVSGSTRKVHAVRLLTEDELKKIESEKRDAEYSEWILADETSVTAKYLRFAGGSVQLEPKDGGEVIRLKLSDLSKGSADYARKLIRASKK